MIIWVLFLTAVSAEQLLQHNGAICENRATGFFVIDNLNVEETDAISYKDTAEEDCLKTCSTNRDQFGRSILCASFVYDHLTFTCTIYREKIAPIGTAVAVDEQGKRYFEKMCLSEEVPLECADSQFIRSDQAVLIGYATEVTLKNSIEDCVAHCASNSTCKSVMYFYEEKECIVNTESALTRPKDFHREENDKVIYFNNGCMLRKESEKVTEDESSEQTTQTENVKADAGRMFEREFVSEEEPEKKRKHVDDKVEGGRFEFSEDAEAQNSNEGSGSAEFVETSGVLPLSREEFASREGNDWSFDSSEPTREEKANRQMQSRKMEKVSDVKQKRRKTTYKEEKSEEYTPEEYTEYDSTETLSTSTKSTEVEDPMVEKLSEEDDWIEADSNAEYEDDENDDLAENIVEADHLAPKEKKMKTEGRTGYVKYRKHPKSFASKTRQVDKQIDTSDFEDIKAISEEDFNEPLEARTKPHKKSQIKIQPTKPDPNQYFSEWSAWTPCTKAGERQIRRRKCVNLRRCLGALMQLKSCTKAFTTIQPPKAIESIRSVVEVPQLPSDYQEFATVPERRQRVPAAIEDDIATQDDNVWGAWQGKCQHFAAGQPCTDGQMIGFESRECVAEEPWMCKGPFFRYCTLTC